MLACGKGAVLSHRSAASLWALLPPVSSPVHITIRGDAGRDRRSGIRIHRSQTLVTGLVTRRRAIPVTIPARTLADLRRVVPAVEFRQAIRQAEVLGLSTGLELHSDATRSELERRFLHLCRRHRLPRPDVNVAVGRFVVDFLWRDQALIAETDGYRYHRGRVAFESDRARDLELRLLGYEVVRFTHRQVNDDPSGVAAALRALL